MVYRITEAVWHLCLLEHYPSNYHANQWQIQRGIQGCTGTPLWAAPSTKKY